ncbi:STAS domain-containing protein [Streptomyces erythrochromogenes]|uniref:STAS domain-containing protein n=1 Tax=Streptomyces erythrochromogenes TaxID=285574 RepID=UPI0036D05B02
MNPIFDIAVGEYPGGTLVTVAGDLDMDTCPYLTEVADALDPHGQHLLLDLSAVTFMDCQALHAFLALHHRAEALDGTLQLLNVPEHGLRLFDITGIRRLFTPAPMPNSSAGGSVPRQPPALTTPQQPHPAV